MKIEKIWHVIFARSTVYFCVYTITDFAFALVFIKGKLKTPEEVCVLSVCYTEHTV